MKNHLRTKKDIEIRQACIKDISTRNNFRLKFAITGLINRSADSDDNDIQKWAGTESSFTNTWARILIWLVPSVNIILLVCGLANIISMSWFGLVFSVFVILSFSVIKRATALQEEYGKKLKTLSTYARLITLAQNEEWNAEGIKDIVKRLEIDGKSPADALNALTKELDRLDLQKQSDSIRYIRRKYVLIHADDTH